MKCLIVDDEAFVRESLRMIGRWAEHGIDCVLEAESGYEALEIIAREHPEIMITDMKMEGMDGAELLRRLTALPDAPQPLVISGYSDFPFMHSAISSGAADYILKPVSVERFNEGVELAVHKWLKRHREDEVAAHGSRSVSIHSAMANEMAAYPMVQSFIADHPRYLIFGFRVISFSRLCTERYSGIPDLFYYALQCDLERQMEGRFPSLIVRLLGGAIGSMTGLVALETNANRAGIERDMTAIFHDIAAQYDIRIALGFSEAVESLEELNKALHQANRAVASARLTGSSCVYVQPTAAHALPELDADQLRQLLLNGDAAACADQLIAYLTQLRSADALSYRTLGAAFGRLRDVLKAQMAARSRDEYRLDELELNRLRVSMEQAICHFDEMRTVLEAFLAPYCAELSNTNTLFNRMRAYVDAHYSEKLGLDTLSKTFFISREYASRIFKKELGTTFVNYLTDVRLEHVCRLLTHSDDPIANIADQTGFKESAYLIRVFQKKYNMTPKEYRRKNGKKSPEPLA